MTHEEMVTYLREALPEADDIDIEQAMCFYCGFKPKKQPLKKDAVE